MANEYISKQRAKDLMGCCLASAKANYKEETDVFKRAKFQCYVETIEAMIDVVGAVEAADVQPIDRWISFKDKQPQEGGFYLTYYAEHIRVSQWFPSKNWYNEHGGNVTNMVEYWQPLPELPKQ